MSKQIALISNVYLETYIQTYIDERFPQYSTEVKTKCLMYEEYHNCVDAIEFADIIAICLSFEEFYPNLSNDVYSEKVTYKDIKTDCINKCSELYSCIKKIVMQM